MYIKVNAVCPSEMKYSIMLQPFSDKGNPNLLSHATDERWQLVRKAIMPAFSIGSLK